MTSRPKLAKSRYVIIVSVAATFIFFASYMLWGKVSGSLLQIFTDLSRNNGIGASSGMLDFQVVTAITGWNGRLSFWKLELPNWLVPLSAIGAATVCWLKELDLWDVPVIIPIGLAAYGFLHSGFFLHTLLTANGNEGIIGVGSLLTFFSCIVMLVVLIKQFGRQKIL
ncbi:hypothetical protein H6F76_07870 [Leptolyngbya sp. FACHB-321]|uniref:hypothetical protein n=1 Tax=Leptolyngbya sp. FACHB-321 TaxID=2692807 RepID=UPI001684E069|nr:hypothetical protein [Leptolyngbya sp. FACHB-321]MBD2034946.1 hypothetical protein [Leptolyngbya sp. FACHB-321]